MKHIIGIDAGTNSTGWTLTRENDDKTIDLIDIGTYIFPIGTIIDEQKGTEKTKNEQRRIYRGSKRKLFRYKLRRKNLKKILCDLKMLPDFDKYTRQKEHYQSYELYENRARALDKQIDLKEIGRIFLLINKHRGFLSNAKKKIVEEENNKETEKEQRKVSEGINSLTDLMNKANARTIGEYFYKMHLKAKENYEKDQWHNPNEPIDERAYNENGELIIYNSRGIRRQYGRYTSREMYEKEFDLIWETQKKYYDEVDTTIFTGSRKEWNEIKLLPYEAKKTRMTNFKKTNYWLIRNYCLFYQRPLKSQKKFVSKCQFEKNKTVIPASSPLYQEFRIWKNISDLRYNCKETDTYNKPLPIEWKRIIANYLEVNEIIYIAKTPRSKKGKKYLVDILPNVLPSTEIKTEDLESEKYIKGNQTYTAFYNVLREKVYSEYKFNNKLYQLWEYIYMAKDDDWLKDILAYKWKMNEEKINDLLIYDMEEGYGSYSTKVIKKILPFMKEGNDEHSSLVIAGYLEENNKLKDIIPLKKHVSQLKYQELRNPVVEKAVSQVIKIVNAILDKYDNVIDREKLEIHIETTRELKKPRKEREKLRSEISNKDKARQELADFLNMKKEKGELNFSGRIEKYDSIIKKYELWLELGMDKNDPAFNEFVIQKDALEKLRLWKECNRICPYSGRTISLTLLFSPEIEIEHIIPLSRCLNDSFNNKTITFSDINRLKNKQTSYEYMKSINKFDEFESRIKKLKNSFSAQKIEQFLRQDIEYDFTNNQLTNTSYIARYVRKKMHEVCRNIQFTNGFATAELRNIDWTLSDLLDKIKFEESTGTEDIDYIIDMYRKYKKEFDKWYESKQKSTDIRMIGLKNLSEKLLEQFKSEKGINLQYYAKILAEYVNYKNGNKTNKDRTDYRNHAIDAFIIAACTNYTTNILSRYNREREEMKLPFYDENGNPSRKRIKLLFNYSQLKAKVKNILVCHNVNQKLMSSKKDKNRKLETASDKLYSPQGSLHNDGIYGKLKNPRKQGFERDDVYVKRISLYDQESKSISISSEKGLENIYDPTVKKILYDRICKYGSGIKAFSKESLEKDPIYIHSLKMNGQNNSISKKGKPLPAMKNVRKANKNVRNLISIPVKDEQNNKLGNKYVETSDNYLMVFYNLEKTDLKGKNSVLREFKLLSFSEAINRKRNKEKMFEDVYYNKKDDIYIPLQKECSWLKKGDSVILFEKTKNEIQWSDKEDLKKRLFIVKGLDSGIPNKKYPNNEYGYVNLLRHSHTGKSITFTSEDFCILRNQKAIRNSHKQINAIKVRMTPLGEISLIGEECF
jgi:CRISPR-associated endonuclease Csn1